MNPVILYQNCFASGTLTASETASGFDVANVVDFRPYTLWKGTLTNPLYITMNCGAAVAADALGICGHTLGTCGATIDLEHSANGSNWTSLGIGYAPSDDAPILKLFNSATKQYWRLKITGHTIAPVIGVLMVGPRLTFPYPPETPHIPFDEGIVAASEISKTGNLLGSVINYKPIDIAVDFGLLPRTFVFDTYKPFWDNHASNLKPFFWAFDASAYGTLVYYAMMDPATRFQAPLTTLSYVDRLSFRLKTVKTM